MGDPFSVAGSAVGVISLGLTVCQGLLTYYGPFKAYDEEIRDVSNHIKSFQSTLKALENVLANSQIFLSPLTAQSATVALDSIFNCQEGLGRLSKMLNKCKSTSTKLLGSKIQINRILYPVRRDTLMTLLETVNWLQAHLNTSLQILNMAMLAISQKQTDMVLTYSASSASDTSQMLLVAQKSDQRCISIEHRLGILEDHLRQMQCDSSRNKARSALTPGLLQSALEHQQILDEESHHQGIIINSQGNRRRTKCSCGMAYSGRARNAGSACIGRCELHTESKTIMTLLHRRIFCRWALRISLETSFTSTVGAGGFSISPKLEFRAIVPRSSEIFSALYDAEDSFKSQDVSTVIQNTQKALFEAFREGKASKSDALQSGDTILHVVTSWQRHSSRWDTRSWLTWRLFIKNLLQAGLSPDRVNDWGETPADSMIRNFGRNDRDLEKQQITMDICSDLLKAGGYMTRDALHWRHQENYFYIYYHLSRGDGRRHDHLSEDFSFYLIWRISDEKGLQDIDLPEELQPLVYKSRELLTAQLRRGIDFHRWIKSYTRWGDGLALILQSGYAPTKEALQAACEVNCEESVKILVNDHKCFIGNEALKIASFHPNQAIVDLIVSEFIDRRRRLQALAEAHLPRSVQDQLRIESKSLLNSHAYEAYSLLEATSADLKGLLERHRWSVFDCVGVNLDLADRLWTAGFRGVDEIDDDNKTCLENFWRNTPPCDLEVFLQKTRWFISKGADVYHQTSSGSVLHDIGNGVGSTLYWMKDEEHSSSKIHSLSEPSKALLRIVLSDNTPDDCECACSLNGCSPLTTLLSGLLPTQTDHETSAKLIHLFADLLSVVLLHSKSEPEPDERFKSHLSAGILRFITFTTLGISHTCMHEYRKIEPREIVEIQDEEKLSLLDLEMLLTQFLEELNVHGLQVQSYITGLWWTNMASFLSTRRSHTAEEITQILELGVILDGHETQGGKVSST